MSNSRKRARGASGGVVAEQDAEDNLLHSNRYDGVDLHTISQNAWMDQDVYLDAPRQSQYLGPGYMNSIRYEDELPHL